MACNPQFHKRSKHIATQWHWVCDLVQNGTISIESCRDPGQTANVLTKPLAHPKHQRNGTNKDVKGSVEMHCSETCLK